MCGITGFFERNSASAGQQETLERMTRALRFRGPDDEGSWVDKKAGIFLGHRRLSVLDLSPEGHQPMISRSGRYTLVFNGEIYNFQELREELIGDGHVFRGTSDTEVMLAAFEQWGLEEALKKFDGMFAFALWDRQEESLSLARDRLGEKPLYYTWQGKSFLFGSELKALRYHPAFQASVDRKALKLMLKYSYVPGPLSIYKGVFKLPPGHFLKIFPGRAPGNFGRPQVYWSAVDFTEKNIGSPFRGSSNEAADELEKLLLDSVKKQMVADVPLGVFLSGGVDSSTIVALMQSLSPNPIRSFTIGFEEEAYNETFFARKVAEHLGTEHTELYVSFQDALSIIPSMPDIYDEPFSDSSQIPTSILSSLTHNYVTVSLSGDGGDELFGGYNRYLQGQNAEKFFTTVPYPLRQLLVSMIDKISPGTWDWVLKRISMNKRYPLTSGTIEKITNILRLKDIGQYYQTLVTHWEDGSQVVLGGKDIPDVSAADKILDGRGSLVSQMMLLDLQSYLPDDILVKLDRAAMAVSLETRVPFLDRQVVEFALRLPLNFKIQGTKGKRVLREVLYRYVPPSLIERPKMGFGIPLDSWLRGPLRRWAEDLLDEGLLKRQNFLNPEPILHKWQEHISGKRNWQYVLWDILMWQSWLQTQNS